MLIQIMARQSNYQKKRKKKGKKVSRVCLTDLNRQTLSLFLLHCLSQILKSKAKLTIL